MNCVFSVGELCFTYCHSPLVVGIIDIWETQKQEPPSYVVVVSCFGNGLANRGSIFLHLCAKQ